MCQSESTFFEASKKSNLSPLKGSGVCGLNFYCGEFGSVYCVSYSFEKYLEIPKGQKKTPFAYEEAIISSIRHNETIVALYFSVEYERYVRFFFLLSFS